MYIHTQLFPSTHTVVPLWATDRLTKSRVFVITSVWGFTRLKFFLHHSYFFHFLTKIVQNKGQKEVKDIERKWCGDSNLHRHADDCSVLSLLSSGKQNRVNNCKRLLIIISQYSSGGAKKRIVICCVTARVYFQSASFSSFISFTIYND